METMCILLQVKLKKKKIKRKIELRLMMCTLLKFFLRVT